MKTLTAQLQKRLGIISILLLSFFASFAQVGVLDPNDPVVTYNANNRPTQPPAGQIKDWVRTRRVGWNTDEYKCYIYQGMVFRLKFPKSYQHNVADGKKYPLYIFFHGLGEYGNIYDNEAQLIHGGQSHMNAVNQDKFDGFLFYPQNEFGYFGPAQYGFIKTLIEQYFVPQLKVDIDRIIADGLSAGGTATWEFARTYPQLVSAILPISAANGAYANSPSILNSLKFIPIWHFQGGQDPNPTPNVARQVGQALLNVGANYRYTEYPNRGHSCWNDAWAEAEYYPFLNSAHKANPVALFGKFEFCEGETPNVTLGISEGFTEYQWRKNGVVIPGATSNTYQVTDFGTYDCRIRRGSVWSPWSPKPVVVKVKAPTITPPIQPAPGQSAVIPSLASNNVTLQVPAGFETYTWRRVGSTAVIGTTNSIVVSEPGSYEVKVTERFGCIAEFSAPFVVSSSTGPNRPDAVTNVTAVNVGRGSIKVDWVDNPHPVNNETGFEIYTAEKSGGPYSLAGTAPADAKTLTVNGIEEGKRYFVVVRAINATAASVTSMEAEVTTSKDVTPPTAPTNFRTTNNNGNNVNIAWNASTDDRGVFKYDLYINDKKSYIIDGNRTTFTVYNLRQDIGNKFILVARDSSGNESGPSNLVFYYPNGVGVKYKYYTGSFSGVPNFNALTPATSGFSNSAPTIAPRTQNDQFAFLWEGFINIPAAGDYTFSTNAAGWSNLWIGSYNPSASPVVQNNGGVASGTISLTAGVHPITIAYAHETGAEAFSVSWSTPSNASLVLIPNAQFQLNNYTVLPELPQSLSGVANGFNKVNLSWVDNSSNETSFEISRSTNPTSGFAVIASVPGNTTSYTDSIGIVAGTNYFYLIRAQTGYGQTIQTSNFRESQWNFDGNYNDSTGLGRTLSASGSPTFDAVDKVRGSHSLNLNGTTNQFVSINSPNNYLREAYTQRSVSLWFKSLNNTGRRILVDIGGNDDGLALMIDNGNLVAGIAANNVRKSLTIPFTSTDWTHVALVYDRSSLKLYINGALAASDEALGFTALTTTSNASRIGANNSSNALNIGSGLLSFQGKVDEFNIYSGALTEAQVVEEMNGNYTLTSRVTIPSLPVVPNAPSTLVVANTSSSQITIQWSDLSDNETGFEIYRSVGGNNNFVLVQTVSANTTQFSDSNLFANASFDYQIRAINAGGGSTFTNMVSASTQNNLPVIGSIQKQFMRFGTSIQVNVIATDADNGQIQLSASGLPSFATFTTTQNGSATITFAPQQSDIATYQGLTVTATDNFGGTSSVTFDLEVNDNYAPAIQPVSNITLAEKQVAQVTITATDQNLSDQLEWTFRGLPSFATPSINNRSVAIALAPGFTDHGPYDVTAVVGDGRNSFDSTTFRINVTDVTPGQRVMINFNDGSFNPGAPWNSTGRQPGLNNNHPGMLDVNGAPTTIGFRITSSWQNLGNGSNTLGATTGNNSGVYPDNVMRTSYWTDANPQTIRFYGLDPNTKYNFTFFGSRGGVTDNRTSNYTINGNTVSLNGASNTQNTVRMLNVVPLADSSLVLTLARGTGSSFAYLNSLVIDAVIDDSTAPARPRNVSAALVNGISRVTWLDAAFNESGYQVYRSESIDGTYSLLNQNQLEPNTQQFNDSSIAGGKTYFYTVRAVNVYGNSAFSDTVSISIPNVTPIISGLQDIRMKTQQVRQITFQVHDPEDIVTLTTEGLPSFAQLTGVSNGQATLTLSPGNTIANFPNIVLTATDSKGASSTVNFGITVTDKDVASLYVNFNRISLPLPTNWNSFNGTPFAGRTLSNLVDEELNSTSIGVTLVDAWEGDNDLGAVTGNNSGVFPDNAMKTAYYESSSNARRIRITGLSTQPGIKYNLVFFASRTAGDIRNTVYSAGGTSVTLNAGNNTNNTVQINGLTADANGTIEFTAQKAAGSPFGYINAMSIQSYVDNGNPISPSNLVAKASSKSAIQLTWNDKSGNEDGFQVFRSLSPNGPFNLVQTVAPNTTSYTDNGLQSNTLYYYKVRAFKEAVQSEFTNVAGVSTYTISILINFNRSNNQGSPWNNTAATPEEGRVFSNLRNDLNNSSGVNMTVVENFSGDNPSGMITGNNSGVVPDNVMRSSWWLDFGLKARLKFSGLNQNWAYNFDFFGSRNGGGDRTTVYTINGRSVSLNASFNTSQIVTLDAIRPDENGEIEVEFSLAQYAQFAYINGMRIHAYEVGEEPTVPFDQIQVDAIASQQKVAAPSVKVGAVVQAPVQATQISVEQKPAIAVSADNVPQDMVTGVSVYPNPFLDYINLQTNFSQQQALVTVQLFDQAGRLILNQQYRNVSAGRWVQRISLPQTALKAGVYILRIIGDDKKPHSIKLVKN